MGSLRGQALFRKNFLVLVIIALALFHHPGTQAASPGPAAYRHAYYLFLDGAGSGCEACYVPLLITQNTLEKIAAGGASEESVLIITYERDSIWQNKGAVPLNAAHIESAARLIHLNARKYRYQEISIAEALKLLENPMGSIPISRPAAPGKALEEPTREELIRALKKQ